MVSQFSAQALVPRVLRQYSRGTSLSVCVRSCTAGIASAALELHPDQVEQWGVVMTPKASSNGGHDALGVINR